MKFSIVNKFFRWKLKISMALFYVLPLITSCAAPAPAALINECLHRKHFMGHSFEHPVGPKNILLLCTDLCLHLALSIKTYIYVYIYVLDLDQSGLKHSLNPPKCLILWPWSSKSRSNGTGVVAWVAGCGARRWAGGFEAYLSLKGEHIFFFPLLQGFCLQGLRRWSTCD